MTKLVSLLSVSDVVPSDLADLPDLGESCLPLGVAARFYPFGSSSLSSCRPSKVPIVVEGLSRFWAGF